MTPEQSREQELVDFFAHRLYDAVSTAVALVRARGLSDDEAYAVIMKVVEFILHHLDESARSAT